MVVMDSGGRTYVGFGFGAIQAGLFLHEAHRAGAFGRLVVADVLPEVVRAVRQSGGHFSVNIADDRGIAVSRIGPVEIFNPEVPADCEALAEAVAEAVAIGTAVPGVHVYKSSGPGSLHRVLAEGLRRKLAHRGPPSVIYAAENHNRAAEILSAAVAEALPEADRVAALARAGFVNTVVGKMSGLVTDTEQMRRQGLVPVTPGEARAFLVEAFNRILISRARFDDAGVASPVRGLSVFEAKDDLLPFEEAKLYGHNAVHALAAYLGLLCGAEHISDLPSVPGMMAFLRAAFVDESGAALVRKFGGVDPLFSAEGYLAYAEDLLHRMVNPHLCDTVERVARHPERKLGWDDRLIGTMRVSLAEGVEPPRFALGAAAALACLDARLLRDAQAALRRLADLWGDDVPGAEAEQVFSRIASAIECLRTWRESGEPFDRLASQVI